MAVLEMPATGSRPRRTWLWAIAVAFAIAVLGNLAIVEWPARAANAAAGQALDDIAADPVLRAAIAAQNAALAADTQADIDVRDATWIAEGKSPAGVLNGGMLAAPASRRLQAIVARSDGIVRHAILMDDRGRNVAIAAPTTDYWQGDEAKWLDTFAKGAGARHASGLEVGHDGRGVVCWVGIAVSAVAGGPPIGAIAIEVDARRTRRHLCGVSK